MEEAGILPDDTDVESAWLSPSQALSLEIRSPSVPDQRSKSAGTLPPFSASFWRTRLCSQTFMLPLSCMLPV